MNAEVSVPPEFNVTGQDYAERGHFRFEGPLIDIHAHVMVTRPADQPTGPPSGSGPDASIDQAVALVNIACDFGIVQTLSMCLPDDIPWLRQRLGEAMLFNGVIGMRTVAESADAAYQMLDRYLELGVKAIKFWAAPRGRDRGLVVDAPWRMEAVRRASAAGIRLVMVHIGDPDAWFRTVYADASQFGTKADQYDGLRRMLELFPDMNWLAAHMGGDSEHPEHLEELLEKYPHLYFDTSATKWVVREVSPRRDAYRRLMGRFPERFLFGTDLVTRHHLLPEHYTSRYWCQRTLWESSWEGPSPIADPDYLANPEAPLPKLAGLNLPLEILEKLYFRNAARLLNLP